MSRAYPLPAVRRRTHLAIGADWGSIRMLPEVPCLMHRVVLGEHIDARASQKRDPLICNCARAEPDSIDPVIGKSASALENLNRNSAIDTTHRDMGPLMLRDFCAAPGRAGEREQDKSGGGSPHRSCPV